MTVEMEQRERTKQDRGVMTVQSAADALRISMHITQESKQEGQESTF